MLAKGHTYDFQYDWLLKKSKRDALKSPGDDEDEEEEKEEAKVMTKAEKFKMAATQEKFDEPKAAYDSSKKEDSKGDLKEKPITSEDKSKPLSKQPSAKRKTTNGRLGEEKEEESKKPNIYDAMKGAGFGLAKPKIVTNNVRSYRF